MIRNAMMVTLMVLALSTAASADERPASAAPVAAPAVTAPAAAQPATQPAPSTAQTAPAPEETEFAGATMLRFIKRTVEVVETSTCTGVQTTSSIQMASY